MEGFLKQKLQGADGILCWKQRHFVLNAGSRCVSVADTSDGFADIGAEIPILAGPGGGEPDVGARLSATRVSLEGARQAVAWSGINAFNGCGFDIVWASGRVWSLLCENPRSRKSWVDALNLSIREAERESGRARDCQVPDSPDNAEGESETVRNSRRQHPQNAATRHRSRQNQPRAATGASRERPPRGDPPSSQRRQESAAAADRFSSGSGRRSTRGAAADGAAANDAPARSSDCSGPFYEADQSSSFDGSGVQRQGELSSSSDWAARDGILGVTAGDNSESGHQQRWRRRPQRRPWREEHAGEPGQDSDHSEPGASSSRGWPVASRPLNGRGECGGKSFDQRSGDEEAEEVVGRKAESSFCRAGGGRGGGGGGSGRSRARERSEELARASAATWGQFQQLLERSRESKTRFDRAMDGAVAAVGAEAVEAAAAATGPKTEPGARSPSNEGRDVGSCSNGVGVAERVNEPRVGPPLVFSESGAPAAKVSAMPAAAQVSALPPPTNTPGVVVDATPPTVSAIRAASGSAHLGCRTPDLDAIEQSRISAVTDVETSAIVDDREADEEGMSTTDDSSGSGSGGGGGGGGGCNVVGGTDGKRKVGRQKRQRPLLSSKLATAGGQRPKRTESDRAAEDALVSRVRQLEAELDAARREAVAAAAQTEARVRQEMAMAVSAAESDILRLREELDATKAAAQEERETDLVAERTRVLAERERDKAAALAATAAIQSQGEAELGDALKAAAKAERERAEAAWQKQQLERDLSAEIAERRRVTELLDACTRSEKSLRERLESVAGDGDLKARLTSTRAELEAVCLERDTLSEELDQCITRLGDQAREVASALRTRQQREVAEISSRCELEKEAIREQLALEADERSREETRSALAGQERRLRAEAAAEARRQAKLGDKKLQEVKAEAEAAGEATRKDIEKLRGLHARRVRRLEALLKEETENLADARREIAVCKATLAGDAGEFQRWTDEQRDQSSKLLRELARIKKRVDGAVAMEAEAREREGLAMGRVRKVMEEARLERAEGVEVRRQLRETLAELESNRGAQARRARSDVQLQRAVEISQQEVAMLEAERIRWYEERRAMETALDRLKRLVYGARSTTAATTTTLSASCSVSSNPVNAPTAATATKNMPTSRWKPAGGARVPAGGRGHHGNTRAVCSPIGVNVGRGGRRDVGAGNKAVSGARGGCKGGRRIGLS